MFPSAEHRLLGPSGWLTEWHRQGQGLDMASTTATSRGLKPDVLSSHTLGNSCPMFPREGKGIAQHLTDPLLRCEVFCGVLGAPQEFKRVKILLLIICSNTGADSRTSECICQIQRAGSTQHKTARVWVLLTVLLF